MTSSRLLVLLALMPLCAACYSMYSVKLAPEARAIRMVNVEPSVPVPDELELADQRLAATGLAGAILATTQGEQRADEMNTRLGGSPAMLAEIVRSEFESALGASQLFELGAGESHATFHLDVTYAGLARPYQIYPGASSSYEMKPLLEVQASLRDPAGKVLWQRREAATQKDTGRRRISTRCTRRTPTRSARRSPPRRA